MKTRTLLILVFTLLIGVVIGFLSAVYIREHRIKDYEAYSNFQTFRDNSIRMLQPGREQMEQISPVVEKYARMNYELKIRYRNEFIELMKQYRSEIDPYLTDEQLRILENPGRRNHVPGRGYGMRDMDRHMGPGRRGSYHNRPHSRGGGYAPPPDSLMP